MVQAVGKHGAANLHLEVVSHREVRQALATGRVFLGKVDLRPSALWLNLELAKKAVSTKDTVRQLFEDFMSKQKVSEVYEKNIRAAFVADVLPDIGWMRPHDVKRNDVVAILRTIEARGAGIMLRRVRMWLRHAYLYLESIEVSTSAPVARVELEIKQNNGIKRVLRKLSRNDNLFDLSGDLEQYRGFVVSDINVLTNTVTFTNGHELVAGARLTRSRRAGATALKLSPDCHGRKMGKASLLLS